MTKEQLIYLAITQLGQGDLQPRQKNHVHRGDVERHFEMAFADIIREVYNNAMTYKDYGQLDAMAKVYKDVDVEEDSDRGEKYSVLPVNVLQLPNHAGIRMITTQCDQSEQVNWRPNNNIGILNRLEVFTTGKKMPTYYVEHKRIYYDKVDADNVMIKLIPTFSAYEDDDEIPVIAGYEGWVYDFVIQRYANGIVDRRPNRRRKEADNE
mgnify:CR=1 FL=1